MSDLTQIVWFIVLFPVLCTVTIFVTVLAHNKAQDWYYQRYGTVATVNDINNDNVLTLLRKQIDALEVKINAVNDANFAPIWEHEKTLNSVCDDIVDMKDDIKSRKNVVTLLIKQVDGLSNQIVDAARLFNKQGDEIKVIESAFKVDVRGIKKKILDLKAGIELIKSDGYHFNVMTRKLAETEVINVRRMESTEGDVRNIMSNLHRIDSDIEDLQINWNDQWTVNKGDRDDTDRSSE